MTDIFKLPRFLKYAKAQITLQRKQLLLMISGGFIALFLFTLLFYGNNNYWRENDWTGLFLTSGAISALLFAGHAFPFLRSKEACQNALMIPASALEKFTYEFVLKIILFTLLFPILFQLMASTVLPLVEFIHPKKTFLPFSFDPILNPGEKYLSTSLVLGYFFIISVAFAGASALRRYPLIKTLVIIGSIILLGVGYFYFLFAELNLKNGIRHIVESVIPGEREAFIWLFYFLGISSLITLTYAYFKLKEREV